MPTTTPTAIPTVLGLLSSVGAADGALDEVTAAAAEVCAADVDFTTDELETGSKFSTLFRDWPVRTIQSLFAPPPKCVSNAR